MTSPGICHLPVFSDFGGNSYRVGRFLLIYLLRNDIMKLQNDFEGEI